MRKGMAALVTFAIFVVYYHFKTPELGIVVGFYMLPTLLLYGIPASILSDYLTRRLEGFGRLAVAGFYHVGFGVLFFAIPTPFFQSELFFQPLQFFQQFVFYDALIASMVFWLSDEVLRSRLCQKGKDLFRRGLNWVGDLRISL